ncbi:MAG TPA: T9SS type A sorting domain-containing protein [Fluviicola sp.]|nr:T9SS type A sorting domain-containing protein [Fluviicola sp.]
MKKIFLAFILFSGTVSFAQNWTGAVSSDWNNAANWSQTPGNGDNITIDPANYTGAMAEPVITGTSNFTPAEMLVQNGAQLTISGTLNASDRCEILGEGTTVTISGGTFALTGGGNNARLIFAENAHLEMNGGALNVGQRLLFELGGTGTVNAGTITVGETIALVDGSLLGSSHLTQNGGTITTNGEFGFENEAGEFYPVFEQTAGTLNINGALIWLGASPGSGRGYFRSAGGTVNVTGTIGNDPASTMGMHLELSGSNALLQNSGNAVTTLAGDSIVLKNNAQWFDLAAASWQNAGVFHAEDASFFRSGNTTLSGTGSYQFDQLEIPSLKLLNHVSPATIAVSGDINVAGTFNHNNNQLVLNGETQQAITTTALGLNLYDLEVANKANGPVDGGYGVSLYNNLHIAHSLALTDGIVTVIPAATIKLSDNTTITGGSDTTFVDGYFEKTGDDAIEFPIGSSPDRYRPLSVSAPATAATVIRVAYKFEPYASLNPVEAPLQSVSVIEYWDLSRSGSADLFSATIGWNDASQSGLLNCNDISMTAWDGTQWAFVPSTTTGLCDGNNAGTLNSSVELPVIGPVTIGFTQNVTQNQVAVCAGESITVDTNTYTQSGVYIDVLEDVNGNDSTVVTILTVQEPLTTTITNNVTYLIADSPNAATYQWIDCNNQNAVIPGETGIQFHPSANGSYAVIVSNNNCTDTSDCAVINQLGLEYGSMQHIVVYPNPVKGQETLTISASMTIDSLEIYTLEGKVIALDSLEENGSVITVALPELTPGTYLLNIRTSTKGGIVKRFIVE